MASASYLTPSQLCDLLNYMLGLPALRNLHNPNVEHRAIHPIVVASWSQRYVRSTAEAWCEANLREAKVLPELPKKGGRPRGKDLPPEVRHWVPTRNGTNW